MALPARDPWEEYQGQAPVAVARDPWEDYQAQAPVAVEAPAAEPEPVMTPYQGTFENLGATGPVSMMGQNRVPDVVQGGPAPSAEPAAKWVTVKRFDPYAAESQAVGGRNAVPGIVQGPKLEPEAAPVGVDRYDSRIARADSDLDLDGKKAAFARERERQMGQRETALGQARAGIERSGNLAQAILEAGLQLMAPKSKRAEQAQRARDVAATLPEGGGGWLESFIQGVMQTSDWLPMLLEPELAAGKVAGGRVLLGGRKGVVGKAQQMLANVGDGPVTAALSKVHPAKFLAGGETSKQVANSYGYGEDLRPIDVARAAAVGMIFRNGPRPVVTTADLGPGIVNRLAGQLKGPAALAGQITAVDPVVAGIQGLVDGGDETKFRDAVAGAPKAFLTNMALMSAFHWKQILRAGSAAYMERQLQGTKMNPLTPREANEVANVLHYQYVPVDGEGGETHYQVRDLYKVMRKVMEKGTVQDLANKYRSMVPEVLPPEAARPPAEGDGSGNLVPMQAVALPPLPNVTEPLQNVTEPAKEIPAAAPVEPALVAPVGQARTKAIAAGIPPKTFEIYDAAVAGNDDRALASVLHKGNKHLRAVFMEEQGVVFPKTEKGSREAIKAWAEQRKTGVPNVAESPVEPALVAPAAAVPADIPPTAMAEGQAPAPAPPEGVMPAKANKKAMPKGAMPGPVIRSVEGEQKAAAGALKPTEQKKILLSEIDQAINQAPAEATTAAPKVKIVVPGDGEFDIFNDKTTLGAFKKMAGKFPTSAAKPDQPSRAAISRAGIAPVPKVRPTKEAEIQSIVGVARSDDPAREVLSQVHLDGVAHELVATDGRRMAVVLGVPGKTTVHTVRVPVMEKGADGKMVDTGQTTIEQVDFAKYGGVVSGYEAGKLPSEEGRQVIQIDTEAFARQINQAAAGPASDKDNDLVILFVDKAGVLQVSGSNKDIGSYISGSPEGARIIGGFNIDFLRDGVAFMRRMGNTTARATWSDDIAPLHLVGAKEYYVVMPKRLAGSSSESNVESMKKSLADAAGTPASQEAPAEAVVQPKQGKKEPKRTGGKGAAGDGGGGALGMPEGPGATPAGTVMQFDNRMQLTMEPATRERTGIPEIMDQLEKAMSMLGSDAPIRSGRFNKAKARGIYKIRPEVIRLNEIDNIPTAAHEVGHALQHHMLGGTGSKYWRGYPGPIQSELQALGKALCGNKVPDAGYTSEGWSEFMRYWLTRDDVHHVAPTTTRWFEGNFLRDNPNVARELMAARARILVWRTQGALARSQQQMRDEPGQWRQLLAGLRNLVSREAQVESGTAIERASQEAARKLGAPLAPGSDPFMLFSWKRGSAPVIARRMVDNNMVDITGNATGPSLREGIAPVKNKRNELTAYLYGRRAVERWSMGMNPGIQLADAKFLVSKYGTPEIELAAAAVYKWWDGILDYVGSSSGRMAAVVQRIRKGSKNYMPLARVIDERKLARATAQAQSNPMFKMHGSGLPVKNIWEQSLAVAERLVTMAHHELVGNAIIKLGQIPGMGHIIEQVPKEMIAQIVDVGRIRKEMEALGVDMEGIDDDEILTYYTPASGPKGTDPVIAWKGADGETRWYFVAPAIYDSLTGMEAFDFRAYGNIGKVADLLLAAPARIFRLGTTGVRPTFSLMINPGRDMPTFLMQTQSHANPAQLLADYIAGMTEAITAVTTGIESPLVQMYANLGASIGQPLMGDVSHRRRAARGLFHGRMMRTVASPLDALRELLSAPEAGPRIAELRAIARELGWRPGMPLTMDLAARLAVAAKRVTVDFSAWGSFSKVANQVVPFYNPAIQGVRAFARAAKNRPGRSILWGLAVLTVPALWAWWQNKGEEWYMNMPWRERYLYTNIDDGVNVWQIPRSFEWGNAFQVIPEALADAWYRKDPEAATAALAHIFETTNPADWPVLVKAAKEQWQNRIAFWDRPIVPRGEVDLLPGAQYGEYTSELSKALGRVWPQVSPRRIDSALRAVGGGVADDVLRLIQPMASVREAEMADMPVIGKLVKRGGYYGANDRRLADFYDAFYLVQATVRSAPRDGEAETGDILAARYAKLKEEDIRFLLQMARSAPVRADREKLYREAANMAAATMEQMKQSQKDTRRIPVMPNRAQLIRDMMQRR